MDLKTIESVRRAGEEVRRYERLVRPALEALEKYRALDVATLERASQGAEAIRQQAAVAAPLKAVIEAVERQKDLVAAVHRQSYQGLREMARAFEGASVHSAITEQSTTR